MRAVEKLFRFHTLNDIGKIGWTDRREIKGMLDYCVEREGEEEIDR